MTVAAAPGWAPPPGASAPAVEVALVNNMPDAAFEDAERQFTGLLQAAAHGRRIAVRLCTLPGTARSAPVRRRLSDHYEDLGDLFRRPPDAVIVTGTEPRCADLRDEALWPGLSRLVRWAVRSTSSAMFSCLAAHAALLELAGVERQRLDAKASGVYRQAVRRHPLTVGLGRVACPHSRLNDVPAPAVKAAGYEVLLGSADGGWTVAAADVPSLTVLVQGHPEYSPTTLLREHRRDVGRYLSGRLGAYPAVPAGYLDADGAALLDALRQAALTGHGAAALDRFPFEACAERVAVDWRGPMERLFANWLTEVQARKLQRAWRRAG